MRPLLSSLEIRLAIEEWQRVNVVDVLERVERQLLKVQRRLGELDGFRTRIGKAPGSPSTVVSCSPRLIDARVTELKARLKEVEKRRERQVSQRHDHLTVSLVGYTNAAVT